MKGSILFEEESIFSRINNYIENRKHMCVSFRKIGYSMK